MNLFSPVIHTKLPMKKIFLDCLPQRDSNIKFNNNINKQTPNKKSYSLYKFSVKKNFRDLYGKIESITQNKTNKRIIINCSEEKQKRSEEQKSFQVIKLSKHSTRKSSNESPVEMPIHDDKKNIVKNSRNPPQFWKSLKVNCISLKKQNNGNFLKNELKNVNIFKSKSKEKENLIDNNDEKDEKNKSRPSVHSQFNHFLNYNKGCNTSGKKEAFYNSVVNKNMGPLKLFDYDASSSSSVVEDEEGEENESSNHNEVAINHDNGNKKQETEYEIDTKFKISEGELSDELNESNKRNNNIFEKKSNSYENNDYPKKPDKSCKNMTCKFRLAQIQNQPSNNNIIISSMVTKAGICDEKEKENQDSNLIIENLFFENFNIYGIFDGHGNNGHLISKYISNFMKDYYNDKLNYYLDENDKNNLFTEKITNIFLKNHQQIIKNCSFSLDQEINENIDYDISQSGSTSIMTFLMGDTLVCSNVGDSQCYLFNCSSKDLWTFESLSKQHLPSDEEEKKRILENGGDIHPYYDENGIFEGPDRVYAKGKIYPGLCMSRTIGDLEAKKIGVISEPNIIVKKIDNNSKFLVIGSDGLWDVIKPYDIIRMARPLFNKGDIEGVCQILMKKAIQQWDKNKEERDDITIIVVFIGTLNNCLINEKNNFLKKIEETEDDKEISSKRLTNLDKKEI